MLNATVLPFSTGTSLYRAMPDSLKNDNRTLFERQETGQGTVWRRLSNGTQCYAESGKQRFQNLRQFMRIDVELRNYDVDSHSYGGQKSLLPHRWQTTMNTMCTI